MSIYEALSFFLIYSFIGWVTEVIYQAVTKGKIMNRGFLNGPVCPVYGFGVVSVLALFSFLKTDNFFLIFFAGMFLTSVIELTAGFVLHRFFHARWWDYSNMPLNIGGYVCPAFSLIWGFAVVFVVRIAHPMIRSVTVDLIPLRPGIVLLSVFSFLLLSDTVVTSMILIGLNRKLKELDDISSSMRRISDKMSESIGTNALRSTQAAQSSMVQYSLGKAELTKRYEERKNALLASLSKHRHFGVARIISAFPDAKHRDYKEFFNEVRKRLSEK